MCVNIIKGVTLLSQHLLHKIPNLWSPPTPIVSHIVAPIIEPSGNAVVAEYCVETARGGEEVVLPIALTDADDDATIAVFVPIIMVAGHPREIIFGRIAIYEFIGIIAEEITCVIQSALRYQRVEKVGAAEEGIGGMKTTHRTTRGNQMSPVANLGYKFVTNVMIPPFVLHDASVTVPTAAAPRFGVDAVAANQSQTSALDEVRQSVNHSKILVIEKPAVLRRKNERSLARVSINLVFHIAAKVMAVMFSVFYFHNATKVILFNGKSTFRWIIFCVNIN